MADGDLRRKEMKITIEKNYCKDKLPDKSGKYLVETKREWITTLNYSKKHKAFNVLNSHTSALVQEEKIEVKWWADISELVEG